jgi:S-adenosylmethionine hydrolase
VLAQTIPYLPAGVHVAVVDPGVGTTRRAVAVSVDVEAGERIFLGPDNGVLSWAVHGFGGPVRAFELTNRDLWLAPVSPTFHGRDLFMPVAARLAAGLELAEVGRRIDPKDLLSLPLPVRRIREGAAEGEVLTVDRFGNVQLSLTVLDLDRLGIHVGGPLILTLGRRKIHVPYRETFGSVPPGELVAYVDSAGCVALAVNSGNAARRLTLPAGSHVHISPAPPPGT